jgi:hypothetical protein
MNVVTAIALRICIFKRIQNNVIIFAIYFRQFAGKHCSRSTANPEQIPYPKKSVKNYVSAKIDRCWGRFIFSPDTLPSFQRLFKRLISQVSPKALDSGAMPSNFLMKRTISDELL